MCRRIYIYWISNFICKKQKNMSLKLSDEQSALISTYKDVITLIIEKCGDSVISKYETLYDGIPSEAEIMSKVSNEEYDRIKKFLELD